MSYQSNCDCIHIWIKGLLQHYKQAFTTKKTSGVCGQHTSMEQQPWLYLNVVQAPQLVAKWSPAYSSICQAEALTGSCTYRQLYYKQYTVLIHNAVVLAGSCTHRQQRSIMHNITWSLDAPKQPWNRTGGMSPWMA